MNNQPDRCLFCGCGATAMTESKSGIWAVYCNNDGTAGDDVVSCGAVGPERNSEAEAIAAWNTRPSPPAGGDVERAREIAAQCVEKGLSHPNPAHVRAGGHDDWHLVRAFQEALRTTKPDGALREALQWIAETCRDEVNFNHTDTWPILLRHFAAAAEKALSTPPAQQDREKLEAALRRFDAVGDICPAKKTSLGENLCPKCGACGRESCREQVRAAGVFIDEVRAALGEQS